MCSFEKLMDKTLRSILWVLVALVLLSSFSAGWFFVAKEKLYNDYVDLEHMFKKSVEKFKKELAYSDTKNYELTSRLQAVRKELAELEAGSIELKSQQRGLLDEKEDFKKEIKRIKKAKFFLEDKLKEMESDKFTAVLLAEKVSLEMELKRLKDAVLPKDLKISRLKAEIYELGDVKKKLDKLLAEKDREIDNLKVSFRDRMRASEELRAEGYHSPAEVDLPPIVLQRKEGKTSSAALSASSFGNMSGWETLEGRIITVNNEHNFAVVDLGRQDGVSVGIDFDVYRDGAMIGSIEVIQARERIAAADIKNIKEGFSIKPDDIVKKRQ